MRCRTMLVLVAWCAGVTVLQAQTEDHPPPPPGYTSHIPDVSDALLAKTRVDTRWFTLRLGVVPILDYSTFSQDAASLEQVGKQERP